MLEVGKLMYQYAHNKLPSEFSKFFLFSENLYSYSTRNSTSNNIYLSRFHTKRTQQSIKYIGVKIWNSRPIPKTIDKSSYNKFAKM